jgi:glutamate-ammonia-ligase adenylyltransferase
VAQEFDVLLGGSDKVCSSCKPVEANLAKPGATPLTDLDSVLTQLPPSMHERLALWRDHPRVLGLREESRGRLLRLVQRTGQWLHEGEISQDAALRLMDWMESLLRRESYLALLVERPGVHQRLLRLLGAARWPARYLLKHPGVIDELAGSTMVRERFDAAAFEVDIERRCKALRNSGEEDDESLLNLLRRAHHAEVFRTLARDVEGLMTVEQVADDLSALAEVILRITVRWVWQRMQQRHCELPRIAIIAYGKLGGKELGYGGDLDIVFLYDDPDDRAGEMYGTLVRKLINWLTVKTGEGDLYEIDTALRPNGSAGLLVTSFAAYADYQQQRGSNTAWTWEHQAMTRARCVLGSADLHSRFDAIREAVICSERDQSALRMEISAMRQKVSAAHPVPAARFDVKHSPGGMVDIEFAVQFMVLAHGHAHPGLRANVGNIALLQAAQDCGLLPAPLGYAAAKAYRMLRSIQHKARLNEDPTQVALAQAEQERQAGLAVWRAVFGD